jgi:chitinase
MKRNYRITAGLLAFVLTALLIAFAAQTTTAQSSTPPKRVVGDYGYWSKYDAPAYGAAQIPFNKLTHINHAGVGFNPDGSLSVPAGFLEPALNQGMHAAGGKVLLLLGGDFTAIETDPAMLPVLVSNLWAFENENGYDGFDIDWEFPETAADHDAFISLLKALRQAFPSPMYTISVDVAPWGGQGYGFTESVQYVDYLNIMMYDCAGPWTDDGQLNSPIIWDRSDPEPYECIPGGSAQQTMEIYLNQYHVAPAKLNLGMPFYGYYYTRINQLFGNCPNQDEGQNCNGSVLTENYGTFFKQRVNQKGWQTSYDQTAMVPYMLKADGSNGFITYDDTFSTYTRTLYADWTSGLGGTFMWSLDADYDGKTQDLLDAMSAAALQQPMPKQ